MAGEKRNQDCFDATVQLTSPVSVQIETATASLVAPEEASSETPPADVFSAAASAGVSITTLRPATFAPRTAIRFAPAKSAEFG